MYKKYTIDEFIFISNQKHDYRYDYSSVVYVRSNVKVRIICPDHGMFEQRPSDHLFGRGCPKCHSRFNNISYLRKNLTIEEDPVRVNGKIKCRCSHCGQYFHPSSLQILHRISSLSGLSRGECRLYCSDECKNDCSIYNRKKYYKNDYIIKSDTSRPDQPELKEMRLEMDNYQCQRCGSTEYLHCHHIIGVEINPIESADIDNCITLCKECHQKAHSEDGCSMRREKCV